MSFLEQLTQLIGEQPGNIVYHVIVLMTLQATIAIALAQVRRHPDDVVARRLAWSSGLILLLRLLLLLVLTGLQTLGSGDLSAALLPPLERAIDAATALFIIWALAPRSARLPRLADALLVISLALVLIFYFYSAAEWRAVVSAGQAFTTTSGATTWGLLQVVALTIGIGLVLIARRHDWALRLAILGTLLAANAAQIWLGATLPSTGALPLWIRLGYLLAFPLLAVFAYRSTLATLIAGQLTNRPATVQMATSLDAASAVIESLDPGRTEQGALSLVAGALPAGFVAVGLCVDQACEQLRLVRYTPDDRPAAPSRWDVNVSDWPAMRLAMEQAQSIELAPDGLGARQLHELYRELGIPEGGPLLLHPLTVGAVTLGVLLVGHESAGGGWEADERALVPYLAEYAAHALHNARQHALILASASEGPTAGTASGVGRQITLEEERDRAVAEAAALQSRLHLLEDRLRDEQGRAQSLAALVTELRDLEGAGAPEALEREMVALRESLKQAEEAMAMAAAGEGDLSTEWVARTISSYSAELEASEARIIALESKLAERDEIKANEIILSLVQELRTPLTSIAGYTELLLDERVGVLGAKQHEIIHRVHANTARMRGLLDQIVQVARGSDQLLQATPEVIDVQAVVESAVADVISLIRDKGLQLHIDIAPDLPAVKVNREALRQIVLNLLNNASLASRNNGRLALFVRTDRLAGNGRGEPVGFLRMSVTDSGGGIRPEDRPHVFDYHYRADNPLIPGLGDTGIGMTVTHALVTATGGRIWIDSMEGVGSSFSVVLPLARNDGAAHERAPIEPATSDDPTATNA